MKKEIKEKCICLEDNKLSQSLCKKHNSMPKEKEIKEKIKEIIGVNKNLTVDNLAEHKTCQILELFAQREREILEEIEKAKPESGFSI